MTGSEQEFYIALSIYGGLILIVLTVGGTLIALGFALRKKLKNDKIIKKIYEEKRQNGQHRERI